MKYLKNNGIGVNFHYPAVYSHPFYKNADYRNTKLKNMEIYYNSCITLPCYPQLTKKDIELIGKLIIYFFKE